MIVVRSLLFFLAQSALTVVWSLLSLLTFPVPTRSPATASSPSGRAW